MHLNSGKHVTIRTLLSHRGTWRNMIADIRGATAVEFAIIASLLLMLTFGILEFGLGWYDYNMGAAAAQRAVRYAVESDPVAKFFNPYLGYNGVLNSGLMGLGIIDEPSTALLYNSSAVIITLTHAWATFAILPIFVSLEKVDRTLVEAATDLGDGPLRSFLRVTLPLSAPGVISAALIVMIPTVGDYVTPKLVGGKDGVMIANAIQAQFGKASNWPLGAALSVTTMIIVSLMAGATVLIIRALQRLAR